MTDPGGETQISGAISAVPPAPRYEDEETEALGEKLAELYARRDRNPRAKIDDVIESTRRDLRRGPRLRAGEFLKDGRYRLIERIGDNSGDATWRAWDRLGQRMIVIKEMVGPWVAKKMRVGTFLEAARTLQSIEHAGLARILEATQSRDGFVYLATDHFEGGTLAQGFTGDVIDVLQVVVEVGNALQAAHERDLVHARVMPNNIHFDRDGGAHLTDFDLAGEHTQDERASVYVAPETVEKGSRGTPTSDVYSLAMCAMFGLNGGKLPYTVVRGPERFIDGLKVSDSVKIVLKRAVEWDLEQRYGSMRAFVDALLSDAAVLEQLAERALARGRNVIASEHYTALWSARPERSVEIKRILGRIYLSMEAWEEAWTCLATAMEEAVDPEPLFDALRAWAKGTRGWKRVADLLWNQARPRKPIQRAAMRAELARITEEHLDDPRGASEMWSLVLQDHRRPARGREALQALARLAEARGDWERMVEHSRALLPFLAPDARAEVQYAIGRALIKHLGNEDEGLKWLDLAEAGGVRPLDMATELQDIRARRGQWRRVLGLMRLEAEHEDKVHAASRVLLRAATIARAVHLDAEAEAIYESLLLRAPQHYPALRALARMRDCDGRAAAAMEAWERLTSAYDGRPEEPEASERAADHTAYARRLIDVGRYEEALAQLEAALKLQGDNVEALRLAAPLHLDLGRLDEGAQALEKLYALFKAVNTDGMRVQAALQRADAAWFRGRLAVAMRWYNTVLEASPQHGEAWWGLSKLAIAARGGHPGLDRAAWLANTPDRYTPQEALARLFVGLFTAPALGAFIARHPLGTGVVEAGSTTARLACATVDLLIRYDLVDAAMFERLRARHPAWARRIDLVEQLWTNGDPTFPVARSYRWARSAVGDDFDPEIQRAVVKRGETVRGHLPVDFRRSADGAAEFGGEEHWQVLLASPTPEEPETPETDDPAIPSEGGGGTVVQFLLGEAVEFSFGADTPVADIGSAPDVGWLVDGLEPRHACLRRIGQDVYLERVGDAEVRVDGDDVDGWRVLGGETVQLGSYLWEIRLRDAAGVRDDDADDLGETRELSVAPEPEPAPAPPPVPTPEPAAADEPPPTEPDPEVVPTVTLRVSTPDSDLDSEVEDSESLVEPGPVKKLGGPGTSFSDPEPSSDIPSDIEDSELPSAPESWDDTPELSEEAEEQTQGPEPEPQPAPPAEPARPRAPTPIPIPTRVDRRFSDLDRLDVEAPAAPADSDYDFEEDETVVRKSPLLGAALRLGSPAIERHPEEDSLGPAGDAPLPHWLTSRSPEPAPAVTAPAVEPGGYRPTMVPLEDDEVEPSPYFSANSRMEHDPDEGPSEGFDEDPFDSAPPAAPTGPRSYGHVEIMSGPARGTQVSVVGVVALGRDESCEIYLPADPMLAPLHCRFVQTDEDGFLVMDNGTERGTVVNGTRVSEAILSGGETIMVGSTVLRFQVHDA